MCYLYDISSPKSAKTGTIYRTLRLQLNKGFDCTTITVNAFENNPKHVLQDIHVNDKVMIEVVQNRYYKLSSIQSCEFEDCYRCAAPVTVPQLGQVWCPGCYNEEKIRIQFNASLTTKTENKYEYSNGLALQLNGNGKTYNTVIFPNTRFAATLGTLNIGARIKGEAWILENDCIKIFKLYD